MPERIFNTNGTATVIGYDADDQRVAKRDGVVFGPGGRVLGQEGTTYYLGRYLELGPDGDLIKYYWAGDRLVARRDAASRLTDFHQDRLGSTRLLTNAKGSVLERYDYDPFGKPLTTPGRDERLWHGQRLDHDSGLIYMNARYYDPELGRFTSPDSIIPDPNRPQSLDRYAYTENNPIKFVDPSGHMKMDVELRKEQAAESSLRSHTTEQRDADELDWYNGGTEVEGQYFPETYPQFGINVPPDPVPDIIDPGDPLDDAGPGGDDVGDPVPDIVDPGGPTDDTASGGGDVRDPAVDRVDPPPPVKIPTIPTLVFEELTIKGKLPAPPPPPPTYTAKSIQFETMYDRSGKTPAKFADPNYMTDINNVVAIMKKDPQVHVTIEAYVGYTRLGGIFNPTGRGEKVYKEVGRVMDARAKAVQDVMVKSGIPVERITLSRGAAEVGQAGRRVDFHFTRE
jgi:RHS repeat-associated protein